MTKNKTYLSFLLIAIVGIFIFQIMEREDLTQNKEQSKEALSGAYQALNFLGARQAYPNTKIPKKAHFAAWESVKSSIALEKSNPATDPWESLGPHNKGGRMLAITFNPENPSTMWGGSASGGLWRTHTGGVGAEAWEYVDTGFPVLGVSFVAFAPNDSLTMYIGTGEVYNVNAAGTGAAYRNTRGSYGMGILKSTDGGETWEKSLDWTYAQNKGVWAIKMSPQNSDIVYAATTDGVYKSTDAGANWDWVLDIPMCNDLLVHPDNPDIVVAGCGNFASEGFGIYKTTDGGFSWHKKTANLPEYYEGKIMLAYAPSNPEIVYASIGHGFSSQDGATWLCRSNDFGTNWLTINETDYSIWQGWFSHDVAISPDNPEILTAIGIRIWTSDDGGTTLTQKSNNNGVFINPTIEGPDGPPNYVHSDAHDVKYHPTDPNIIYIASDGGIHRSIDGGETFHSCSGRLQTTQFYNGFSTSNQDETFCIGGLQDNGTIRWNGDLTWRRVSGGDGSWTAINPDNDDIFYVSSQNLNVRKTTNDGANFVGLINGIQPIFPWSFIAPYVVAPSDGNIMYAGSSFMHKSLDGGDTWIALGPLNGGPALSLDISSQNTDVVYVATAPVPGAVTPGVFVCVDGVNFDDVTGDLPNRFPMDVAVDPVDDAIAYVTYAGFGTGHVYRTQNYGETWEDITNNLPDVPTNAVAVDPLFPTNIYVGNDLGVFASVDNGANWEAYQDGMHSAVMVFDLKISPINRKLRAASHGNGAFERDLLEIETSTEEVDIVDVQQVKMYPNPASDFVNIEYEAFANGEAKIQLMDGNGRIAQAIFNGQISKGVQELNFEVNDLASGIYYVQFVMEEAIFTKKIIVEK